MIRRLCSALPIALAWFFVGLSSIAMSPRHARAQSLPTVTVSPAGYLVTNGYVDITVEFCQLWGGMFWTSFDFKLDGVDVTSQFSWAGSGQSGECETTETWTGSVSLNATPTNQTFRARLWSGGYLSEDMVTYAVPAKGRAVLVASTAGFVNVKPSTGNSQQFKVWNAGEVAATYSLTPVCTGAASSCAAVPTSVWIDNGQSATVTVNYNSSGTVGDTGLVKLGASDGGVWPPVTGEGWTDVTVTAAPSAGVVIARDLGLVPRGSCVTASVGSDAAMECGDLRITHALPAVTTLGKARVPTLIYNSQYARPMPVALADVTLPGGSLPSTVEARVYVDGVQRGYRLLSGSDWGAGGNTRRIAVEIDASGYETSLKSYYVHVTLNGGPGGSYQSPTENLAIVNRWGTNFGAGWWLAGLEEIHFPNGSTILWVGGDGSTRVYTWNGVSFKAANFDRPDSITTSGSDYIRWGPAKLQVRFNSSGLHTSTTNRLGYVTSFSYVPGTRRLSSISVPVKAGSPLVYDFYYDGNAVLYQVTAPNAGTSRTVSLGRNGLQITSITDPDSRVVYFGYAGGANGYRIDTRTDRRGYVTSFSYNSVNHLTQSSLSMGGGQYVTTNLRAAESYGFGTAQLLESMFTLIDGPRTDVGDSTKIWISKYGAPTRIRNAEGRETALWYDGTWPGLVSQTRNASRLLTKATYNSDATLQSTTVYNPLGTGSNATTSYTWDSQWKFVTSITPPVGPVSEFSYNSGNGNRDWEQTGGSSRRVTYGYDGYGLLSSVTTQVATTTYATNSLGNVSEITSPKGYKTYVDQNSIGQDVVAASSFSDTTSGAQAWGNVVPDGATNGSRVKKLYTIVGQDSIVTTHGPLVYNPLSGQNVQRDSVRLEHVYDAEGNVTSTTRKYWPNGGGGGFILQSSWTYDGVGRKLTENSPGSGTRTFGYDPAGNVTSVQSPRGYTVTMTYDDVNRLKTRVVPQVTYSASSCWNYFSNWTYGCFWSFPTVGSSFCINPDTAKFEYEPGGQLYKANNRYARVTRGYKPNGLLASETQQVRVWNEPGETPCGPTVPDPIYGGSEWTLHSYSLVHTYDLAGRRTQTDGPYQVTGCSPLTCRTTWAYNGGAGELSSVTDGMSRTTSFTYDYASRLDYITYANGIVDDLGYDTESRVVGRTVYGGSYINDAVAFDASGRIVRATQNGQTSGQVDTYYGPLGAVIGVTGATYSETGSPVTERFDVDALGNRTYVRQQNHKPSYHPDVNGERYQTLDSYKRLTNVWSPPASGWFHNKDLTYDGSGNLESTRLYEADAGSNTVWDASVNYYDASDRLVGFNRAVGPYANDESHPGQRNVFEEYRYDALGRRVAVRSRRPAQAWCGTATECFSYVERTVWDGDQVVFETRAPGATGTATTTMEQDYTAYSGSDTKALGQTAYVHAGGIDQPIVVMRSGYNGSSTPISVHPHANWRGSFELGTKSDGTLLSYFTGSPQIAWPGAKTLVDGGVGNQGDGPIWFGNLITNKSDGSGMQYMRNRYYDPASGRFTQEDPIGLAGGMNLYGFANGDPINFSDPFGLCPGCAVVAVVALRALPHLPAAAKFAAEALDPNPGAGMGGTLKQGRIVIGETMRRVRAAANEFGAETFETAAKTAKDMWKENSTWLRQAMRDGKEVIDIGEDASRATRSKFYQAEKEVIERRNHPVTRPEPKPEPQR